MAANDETTRKTTTKKTRGRTTRRQGRRTTRRRPKWLPDDEPETVETAEAPEPKPTPTPKPKPEPVIAAPAPVTEAAPTWGPRDWVSVRYEGPNWFIHPQAGVFVPGTTTRLRGDLASQLPEADFRFDVALRKAG